MEQKLTSAQRDTLLGRKQEAFEQLADAETANDKFKAIVEDCAEDTGLSKALVSSFYKNLFNDKLNDLLARAAELEFLSGKD